METSLDIANSTNAIRLSRASSLLKSVLYWTVETVLIIICPFFLPV
jgi:hypothetical protein